jgi:hypothetical protein
MSGAPLLRVKDVAIFERRLTMRMPFRFGAATVTEAGRFSSRWWWKTARVLRKQHSKHFKTGRFLHER